MFWNKKNQVDPYVRYADDNDNARTAYRIAPDDRGNSVALLINGARVNIDNISVVGIAFEYPDAADVAAVSDVRLHGILFIGHEHHSIPVELDVVSRRGNLLRCKICNQNVLEQKKLAEAINHYQKQEIRAREQPKGSDKKGQ